MNGALQQIETLCDQKQFVQAEALLDAYFKTETPTANAWRIKGQIEQTYHKRFMQAINCYIEAIKIEPNNETCLLLLGNLYSRDLHDIDTGMSYYRKLAEVAPDNIINLNNLATNLLTQKKYEEAIPYFDQVIRKANRLEAYLGKGESLRALGRIREAFDCAHHGLIEIPRNQSTPQSQQQTVGLMLHTADLLLNQIDYDKIEQEMIEELEAKASISIRTLADNRVAQTKLEWSPKSGTAVIRYNRNYTYYRYAILHQILSLRIRATTETTGRHHSPDAGNELAKRETAFLSPLKRRLSKKEYEGMVNYLCSDMATFVENTVCQLLVDDLIIAAYAELRPAQVSSLFNDEQLHIATCNDKSQQVRCPATHWKTRRILYLMNGLHLENLYHMNFLNYYKPQKDEYETACTLYKSYVEALEQEELDYPKLLDRIIEGLDLGYLWEPKSK